MPAHHSFQIPKDFSGFPSPLYIDCYRYIGSITSSAAFLEYFQATLNFLPTQDLQIQNHICSPLEQSVSKMAIRLSSVSHAKRILRRSLSFSREGTSSKPPKGHVAVYIGEEEKKRYLVPISYLNQPWFQDLLSSTEEEFGYGHPMGGLTIPCTEDTFIDLISQLS